MKYRWTVKQNYDEKNVSDLSEKLNIPLSLAKTLTVREIDNVEAVNRFLNPSLEDLYDPFAMKNMDKAVDKIMAGIKNEQLFWIHGDYDVDGTGSVALLTLFLKEIGAKVDYFIPDRFSNGYNVPCRSIEEAIKKNAAILITVDVGITSYEMLDCAFENNIETIICDHHEPGDTLPKAYAILDPFQPDCKYPFKPLAACGVAFKLIQAISIKLGNPDIAYKYLDFVALASAADMVPLLDENRILLHFGLQRINNEPRTSFKSLIYCAGLKQGNITTSNIIYAIAPLINAAGRLGQARRSVEMMTQDNDIYAFQIAQQLEGENRKRRSVDQKLFEEVLPIAEEQIKNGNRSLIIFGYDWHVGVIGVVTSRLVDRFHLPTVLLTTNINTNGYAKGSARCLHNFDIYSALKKCEDLLTEFGGHKHASGISLEIVQLAAFQARFDAIAKSIITDEMLISELAIDSELRFSELSPNFFKILNKFAPFGFANQKPLFISHGIRTVVDSVKMIGLNSIRFRAIQDNFIIDAVGQDLAPKIKICQSGKPFSIVYNFESNSFNGQKSPQLAIKDIREEE